MQLHSAAVEDSVQGRFAYQQERCFHTHTWTGQEQPQQIGTWPLAKMSGFNVVNSTQHAQRRSPNEHQ